MQEKLLILSPEKAKDYEQRYRIVRRSLDARQRQIKVNLTVLTDDQGQPIAKDAPIPLYTPPVYPTLSDDAPEVVVIGAGPGGLFAALTLLEHGIRPIVYERGKEVGERKRDIALLNRGEGLNEESNYCFGEGGAGTFSDGKLFSRSKKRGDMQRVMEIFHHFGAPDTVLYEAHAHIGSDRLPDIIRRMCDTIREKGGEIHYESRVDSLRAVRERGGKTLPCILAIGHSAHDTYRMLAKEGVKLEPKGYALGVRVEHPQSLINRLMYHAASQKTVELLGNASYNLVTQVDGRGVYSFCMCPGGHIVPAGSTADACVVNGMSASHRRSPYANSGMVVEVPVEKDVDALTWLERLEDYEGLAAKHGGKGNQAPAQRLKDFVEGRESLDLPTTSYLPGIVNSRLDEWLPKEIGKRLQEGLRVFEKKYPGYLTNDAILVGVESRSSSPIRISRDQETMESISTPGLYPVGEGAGYAGGITSSALDGINAAKKIAERYETRKRYENENENN